MVQAFLQLELKEGEPFSRMETCNGQQLSVPCERKSLPRSKLRLKSWESPLPEVSFLSPRFWRKVNPWRKCVPQLFKTYVEN